jgi:mannose-6-phosphate isomerase-like protein (cupin superfamily)/SAM-dependent methyltransferase
MRYVHSLAPLPSFDAKGLFGFVYGPLQEEDLEVYYIESETGHDTFTASRRATRLYYVIDGSGYFTIGDQKYDVSPGELVEIPPKIEYSYSGKMRLIVVSKPRYFVGNDRFTKWNPDVIQGASTPPATHGPWELFGKRAIDRYLRANRRLWAMLPASISNLGAVHSYGELLCGLARRYGYRAQDRSTCFFRNRLQLELMRRLISRRAKADTLKVAVLGCSTGAEAYSIAWMIRSARPDLKLTLHAVDVSKRAVELARCGAYSLAGEQLPLAGILERMNETEMIDLFDRDGDVVMVKSWIKEGIAWHVGDVAEHEIVGTLGPHDIVVANNFLCHMCASAAESCLHNVAHLVRPNGHIFVSGIDLDVRTKVADDLGWHPLQELIEEIHEGDPSMRALWPWHYAGLEPLNKKRADWKRRYSAAFQVSPCDGGRHRSV